MKHTTCKQSKQTLNTTHLVVCGGLFLQRGVVAQRLLDGHLRGFKFVDQEVTHRLHVLRKERVMTSVDLQMSLAEEKQA